MWKRKSVFEGGERLSVGKAVSGQCGGVWNSPLALRSHGRSWGFLLRAQGSQRGFGGVEKLPEVRGMGRPGEASRRRRRETRVRRRDWQMGVGSASACALTEGTAWMRPRFPGPEKATSPREPSHESS